MCRMFGFRSVIKSQVHRSLVSADNALAVQSQEHPDGWGVVYYLADAPHLIKGGQAAMDDQIFRRVSGVVASETVLAHVRRATTGDVNPLNSHPFQYGKWCFAHNGQVANWEDVREPLASEIPSNFRRYILGDTDSEVLFYLFLTFLSRRIELHRRGAPVEDVVAALHEVISRVRDLADGDTEETTSKLTFIATDGHTMGAVRSQKELYYSTYKQTCLDRDTCPYLDATCEGPTETGFVNHLLISSEPLQGDNTWIELEEDTCVGVDWRMKLHQPVVGCSSQS